MAENDATPLAEQGIACGSAHSSGDAGVVNVYFNCSTAPPGALAPAPRMVSDSSARLRVALENLLAGPTADERARGYHSFFSAATANALLDVRLSADGDTAWLDFRDFSGALPDAAGVRSFLPPGVMAGMTWTLFQSFPDLDAVHFAFDGRDAAFWAWLGGEPEVFTRADWERI